MKGRANHPHRDIGLIFTLSQLGHIYFLFFVSIHCWDKCLRNTDIWWISDENEYSMKMPMDGIIPLRQCNASFLSHKGPGMHFHSNLDHHHHWYCLFFECQHFLHFQQFPESFDNFSSLLLSFSSVFVEFPQKNCLIKGEIFRFSYFLCKFNNI